MKTVFACLALLGCAILSGSARDPVTRARTPVHIPDLPGYVTLKCDFHTHTVFSDGLVWPTVRAEEAWREGLDALAITDHLEYLPHKADLGTNHNRAHDLARTNANDLDLLLVRGSEITRKMPPGHLNAIFLTNSTLLAVSNWQDSVQAAVGQGAFVFWNHPGWEAQITNNRVLWYPEHTALLEQGQLHGIEVVNSRDYYPEAHRWAIEHKLALFANSDIHNPLNLDYHVHNGDHRPMTLVFARKRTPESLREALFARRTAAYSGSRLVGDEAFLHPLFTQSIQIKNARFPLKGRQRVFVQILNNSDIPYELERAGELDTVTFPKELTLAPGKYVLLEVKGKGTKTKGKKSLALPYKVANLLIAPETPLAITLDLEVTFTP
jgi:predicted metal-dependent phosphoesterase TrpH